MVPLTPSTVASGLLLLIALARPLVIDLCRQKPEASQDLLHPFIRRAGSKHDTIQPFVPAKFEHRTHQLTDYVGASLRRANIDAVKIAVGLLGNEIAPLADMRPPDHAARVFGHEGSGVAVAQNACKLLGVEIEIGDRIVRKGDFGNLSLE